MQLKSSEKIKIKKEHLARIVVPKKEKTYKRFNASFLIDEDH